MIDHQSQHFQMDVVAVSITESTYTSTFELVFCLLRLSFQLHKFRLFFLAFIWLVIELFDRDFKMFSEPNNSLISNSLLVIFVHMQFHDHESIRHIFIFIIEIEPFSTSRNDLFIH